MLPLGITSDGECGRLRRAVHHGLGRAGVTARVPQLRVGDAEVPDGLLLQAAENTVGTASEVSNHSPELSGFGFGWLGCGGGQEGDGKRFPHG